MGGSFTDGQVLEWLEGNTSARHFADQRGRFVTAWLIQGEPGNEEGPNGQFISYGATFRECITKFLSGNVSRVDF